MVIIAVYAPTNDSNQTVKDDFESSLSDVISKVNTKKEITMMGDFNGRTGQKEADAVVGR